jgi:hypothetical protein
LDETEYQINGVEKNRDRVSRLKNKDQQHCCPLGTLKWLTAGLEEEEAFNFGLGRNSSPEEGSRDDPDPDDDCEDD